MISSHRFCCCSRPCRSRPYLVSVALTALLSGRNSVMPCDWSARMSAQPGQAACVRQSHPPDKLVCMGTSTVCAMEGSFGRQYWLGCLKWTPREGCMQAQSKHRMPGAKNVHISHMTVVQKSKTIMLHLTNRNAPSRACSRRERLFQSIGRFRHGRCLTLQRQSQYVQGGAHWRSWHSGARR